MPMRRFNSLLGWELLTLLCQKMNTGSYKCSQRNLGLINLMPSGKAPALDRFPLRFYKAWPKLCPLLISTVLEEDKERRPELNYCLLAD